MIGNWAECDNCGHLKKVESVTRVPSNWAMFSDSTQTGSGIELRYDLKDKLLCPDCKYAVRESLIALRGTVKAAGE